MSPQGGDYGASHGELLSQLVQYIVQLPPTTKKVLAMYYHENLHPAEIATCLGLTERDVELIRARTVRLFQTNLSRTNPKIWAGFPRSPYPWLDG